MKIFLNFSLLLLSLCCSAQIPNLELAGNLKNKAVELMDNGQPDEAIKLLEDAKNLDPGNFIYDYEKAYAFMVKHDYKKALEIYKTIIGYDNITDQCYQMLGNLYDMNGEPAKAIKTYDKGLKKFPYSGRLFLEKGIVYLNRESYSDAIKCFEDGIKADPAFPSNYFRAADFFFKVGEPVWGMLYGEIFVNLERGSKRTAEMSRRIYEAYRSNIRIYNDSIHVSFARENTITLAQLTDPGHLKLPFPGFVFEPTLILALLGETEIDLASLNRIRKKFLDHCIEKGYTEKYPNPLFDYQQKLEKHGHLEAYNYWVLQFGNQEAFGNWQEANSEKWDAFLEWSSENPMVLNDFNKFYRTMYE